MVTSNKQPDKKIVKMAESANSAVVPQRTLLGEVNEHITCPLCRGYYIDATTIVECLHSFCRSCIIKHLQVKSYCPVCEMMINSAKPNIKLDKALQDIVYKLVPGLFQREMERRQQFYASRPGPAASATPEQRGEDTERIIFSPEDVISFSLEFIDATDADSISSKSSDSNESQQPTSAITRRFLQCPAVVNISHLKKFISMKFDIDSTQFAIDILYKRVSLPDCYTLMDIAYIYNWKRNEPMRFFYQIIDYLPIRNRLFDINKKSSHYQDLKSSPTLTEETNADSPVPIMSDHGTENPSDAPSSMLGDEESKQLNKDSKTSDSNQNKGNINQDNTTFNKNNSPLRKKSDDEVEKSQFLNSFELTAKNNALPLKSSPTKSSNIEKPITDNDTLQSPTNLPKNEDNLKRKHHLTSNTPELKKLKIEWEKNKVPSFTSPGSSISASPEAALDTMKKTKDTDANKTSHILSAGVKSTVKEMKPQQSGLKQLPESPGVKRYATQNTNSPKRKPVEPQQSMPPSTMPTPTMQTSVPKTVSPLKLQLPKLETTKKDEIPKPATKKLPDLKPSPLGAQVSQSKAHQINKVRMDLLANNSDPTIDRSKILSQVKSSLSLPSPGQTGSGDPLKSLFDSCKINIPSSLSITLTDQKLAPGEVVSNETKKVVNKNLSAASTATSHKAPSPPVHNYIEILKIPDTDPKKQGKPETNTDSKASSLIKAEPSSGQIKTPKSSDSSAKGPVPNLKPISDTKLGKQSGNFVGPITFQQTFEQQLQSLQSDKKSKLPKNKTQVPKLVPATPKSFNAANKLITPTNKPSTTGLTSNDNKTGAALDLSTPHNIQNQLGHAKVFETMQSIENLAKKQNLPPKPINMTQNNMFTGITNRSLTTNASPLRIPVSSNINQIKLDKGIPSASQAITRQDITNKNNNSKPIPNNPNPTTASSSYQMSTHSSPSATQPSPRSQTRSPSSSPKLVIAEEKHISNSTTEHTNINQSNQITSTQLPSMSTPKIDSLKTTPGPSKPGLKPLASTAGRITGIRQPITPTVKGNQGVNVPGDYLTQPQLLHAHHAILRQMEIQNAWLKAKQRQYDLLKNLPNMGHHNQNDMGKDKQ